ncbi:MAG: hypothetical protein V4751_01645 [Pseudomonadota bacterium]
MKEGFLFAVLVLLLMAGILVDPPDFLTQILGCACFCRAILLNVPFLLFAAPMKLIIIAPIKI